MSLRILLEANDLYAGRNASGPLQMHYSSPHFK